MENSKHTLFFSILCAVLLALGTFPGLFDWSNRIEPWVLGVPFAMFWLLFLNFCISLTFVAWYLTDSAKGDLDVDIEAIDENRRDF